MKEHRPDQDAERVRRMLARVVPDAPDEPQRASLVQQRAHVRRRRALAAAAVATAAAAVIVIPPVFLETSPTTNDADAPQASAPPAEPDPTDSVPLPDPFATDPCPREPEPVEEARTTLDPGAADLTSVRLCRMSGDGVTYRPGESAYWVPPADALVLDPGSFVEAVSGLPTANPGRCDAVEPVPDPEGLYLTYADGRVLRLGALHVGCADVSVDGSAVEMSAVFSAFSDALRQQRAALPTPEPAAPPLDICVDQGFQVGYPGTRGPAEAFPASVAIACFTPDPFGPDKPPASGVLTRSQLDRLMADLFAHSTPAPRRTGDCTDSGATTAIIAVNAWRDRLPIVDSNCTGEFVYLVGQGETRYWLPDDESRAIIRSVLGS